MSEDGDGASFEERLRVARGRQGLDAPPLGTVQASAAADGASPLGVGLRVGVELVSALAVAVAIGWALDKWLHTLPLFLSLRRAGWRCRRGERLAPGRAEKARRGLGF